MTGKAAAPKPGEIFECRVARLFNRQGSFVRRRVDLNRRFSPSKITVTDLDLLVIDFGLDLSTTRTIVECKTGSAKELDRMIWLAGLAKLTGTERAVLFVSGSVSSRSRQIGRELDVLLQDETDLVRREVSLKLDRDQGWGAHNPSLVRRESRVHSTARSTGAEVERAYWFLRSEFWHLPPSVGIKRSLAVIDALSKLLVPGLPEVEADALAWLLADALTAFCVAAVELAGNALVLPREEFRRLMVERLAEGIASYSQLERLSEVVDRYVASTLERAGVRPTDIVRALGALAPQPPSYADALIEIIERLSDRPRAARHLALVADVLLAEAVRGVPSGSTIATLPVDTLHETFALVRLCIAFLKRQANLALGVADAIEGLLANGRATLDAAALKPEFPGDPETGSGSSEPTLKLQEGPNVRP